METAAGVRLPLPAGLRKSLRETAAPTEGAVLPFPVPRLAVPPALSGRLSALAEPALLTPPVPPNWLLTPRYAVAASAVLALLLGPFFVRGTDRGLEALGAVREEVSPLLRRTGEEGRAEIGKLRTGAVAAYSAARRSVSESFNGLSARLSTIVPEDFTNPDPEDESAGSSRRPQ